MSRHRAHDSSDETTVIPRITDDSSPVPPPVSPASGKPSPDERPTPPVAPPPVSGSVNAAAARPSPRPNAVAPPPRAADATAIIPAVPATVMPMRQPAPEAPGAKAAQPPPQPQPRTPQPAARPTDADATTIIPKITDADATTTIPRIAADADATSLIPRIDQTTLIGRIPDVPEDDESDPDAQPRTRDDSGAPLRAVRRKDVYASAYADYTRVTVGSVIRTTLRTTGELLITCGLILLLFAGYEIWGKAAIVDSHQNDLNQQLAQEWDGTPSPTPSTGKLAAPPPGNAIGRLYIPRLNKHWVVVQGVTPADIRYAPGHYPKSSLPGQEGNFAVAGHRMRSVFWDLDQLQVGDKIIVETRTSWYVYAVVKKRIVRPSQVEVVSPNPPEVESAVRGTNDNVKPGDPTLSMDRFLTMTTCNPKWDNYQRLIIHAALVDGSERPRADGPPAELKG
jgi:sortase A